MRLLLLLLFCTAGSHPAVAQYFSKEKALTAAVTAARGEAGQVRALGRLAEFYYIYKNEPKGDSVLQRQLTVAELSADRTLLLDALFGEALLNITSWSSTRTFDKAQAFLEKGLRYAEERDDPALTAIALVRKSALYRVRGQHEPALQEVARALALLPQLADDSLRSVIYLEAGDVFLSKGATVPAYRNYNLAFDLGYQHKRHRLMSAAYHRFSQLYQKLSEVQLAKKYLMQSLELNTARHDLQGQLEAYIDLARLTDEPDYLVKMETLVTRVGQERFLLRAKRVRFSWLMTVRKDLAATRAYFDNNEDLRMSYRNAGLATYYWIIGNMFYYTGHADSALHYMARAEPELRRDLDQGISKSIYQELGRCYEMKAQHASAIGYYEKALALSQGDKDYGSSAALTHDLSTLHGNSGDFAAAYRYSRLNEGYRDTLQQLSAQREVTLLEVEQENRKHAQDLEDEHDRQVRTHNLQYMAISLAIAVVFLGMLILGMFPVSAFAIKMLGFISFICLFEFIILLIDTWLHHLTHGAPLWIWLAKIVIIALIFPLHHWLEHTVVHFVASKRLVKLRERLSLAGLAAALRKKPAPAAAGPKEIAEKHG